MREILKNDKILQSCKIYQTLEEQGRKKHLSFHTPGHKNSVWDITELSYSDNLSSPRGCIAEAEQEIAKILGAEKSYILTDGSTCGVLTMLYAFRQLGGEKIAVCEASHKSVFNGCKLLGITPLVYPQRYVENIPFPYTVSELSTLFPDIISEADGLFLTSPDYYGNIIDLGNARKLCDEQGKLLLIDGAHGGHLHFDKNLYAGRYADIWVDGVHKSLPAFTQGAVLSLRKKEYAEQVGAGLDIFRTTSPSYPIMISVEYAVKYPQNTDLENSVRAYAKDNERIVLREDWTKLGARFGKNAFLVKTELEKQGIYPEFCDGEILLFYLSPATKQEDFALLCEALEQAFEKYPYFPNERVETDLAPVVLQESEREWLDLTLAQGRICARSCGLFPPCVPLLQVGEKISEEKIRLLLQADSVFGLNNYKISVFKENKKE